MSTKNALVPHNALELIVGWSIVEARLDDTANDDNGALIIVFDNGCSLHLTDDQQSCCENRYLRTDDDLTAMVGTRLVSIQVEKVIESDEENDYHDMAFLKIQTDKVGVTLVTHNKHNGYYSGFSLRAELKYPNGVRCFIIALLD